MFVLNARKYFIFILISLFLISTFCCYVFSWWNASAAPPSLAAVDRVTTSRVLIFSYFRCGTKFFAALLSQHPGTFLHYEPIRLISIMPVTRNAEEEERGLSLLRHTLRCDFHSVVNKTSVVYTRLLRQYIHRNTQITWPPGFDRRNLSKQMVTTMAEVCEQHPVQVVKMLRLPLESVAGPLLEEFADLKVIFLARDPRPMYNSRRDLKWCKTRPGCIDPREFCAVMEKDLEYLPVLRAKFPGRVMALRYEDLVVDLYKRTEEVFDFLNWDYAAFKVNRAEWLRNHSDREYKADEWRKTMTEEEVSGVEEFCGAVIDTLSSGNFSA